MVLTPRCHRFDGGEGVASQSRNDHGGDANWNRPARLVDGASLYGARCNHEDVLIVGGYDDDLRPFSAS